jgi:hypothetical protein
MSPEAALLPDTPPELERSHTSPTHNLTAQPPRVCAVTAPLLRSIIAATFIAATPAPPDAATPLIYGSSATVPRPRHQPVESQAAASRNIRQVAATRRTDVLDDRAPVCRRCRGPARTANSKTSSRRTLPSTSADRSSTTNRKPSAWMPWLRHRSMRHLSSSRSSSAEARVCISPVMPASS